MGIKLKTGKTFNNPYNGLSEDCYGNVKQNNGNANQKTQMIVLEIYANDSYKETGSRPIDSYSYTINGDDWDTFFAPTSINPVDTNQYSQAYSYIMQLEENIGTEEEPEKVLVWRDWETDQE